jgi:hypothetical protein
LVDYDSARQLTWAFAVVYGEMQGRPLGRDVADALRWFRDKDGNRSAGLDAIETKLADFDQVLMLDLRQGRQATRMFIGKQRPVVEADLELVLPPIAKYDPHEFQKRFAELEQLLPQPPENPP